MSEVAAPSPLTVGEICAAQGCEAFYPEGGSVSAETIITSIAPLSDAAEGSASFLANPQYRAAARDCRASALFCNAEDAQELKGHTVAALMVSPNPYAQFARLSQHFFRPRHTATGVAAEAWVDSTAELAADVVVFPHVYVGPGAKIGAGCVLYPGVFVGAGSQIGPGCLLYPNAVVREGCVLGEGCLLNPGAVVGGDGFGFAPDGDENVKIPQVGGVKLGNRVEMGSNSSVDRGTIVDTEIQEQTKIDSLVQIGHNVKIGKACFLAGHSGVAGSSRLGDRVTLAGQVGVAGHVTLADQVVVLAKSGVSKDLTKPGAYNGIPAAPNREYLRREATLRKILRREMK